MSLAASPENFKSPFTAAEGWGSFSQTITAGTLRADLAVKYGKVPLRSMSLVPPAGQTPQNVSASLDGKPVPATLRAKDGSAEVVFDPEITISAGQALAITLCLGES